jgi:hypothetical protein
MLDCALKTSNIFSNPMHVFALYNVEDKDKNKKSILLLQSSVLLV